jgi:hypothetical protein
MNCNKTLIVFLLVVASTSAHAGEVSFSISVNHTDSDGESTPFLQKEVGFEELVGGAKGNYEMPNFKNTDDSGILIQSGKYSNFLARQKLCAKLDGPNYCLSLPPYSSDVDFSLPPTKMTASDMWHSDVRDAAYDCYASVEQKGNTGTATIHCTDR